MLSRQMQTLALKLDMANGQDSIELCQIANSLRALATGVQYLEDVAIDLCDPATLPPLLRNPTTRYAGSAEANVQALLASARRAARSSTIDLKRSIGSIERMLRDQVTGVQRSS